MGFAPSATKIVNPVWERGTKNMLYSQFSRYYKRCSRIARVASSEISLSSRRSTGTHVHPEHRAERLAAGGGGAAPTVLPRSRRDIHCSDARGGSGDSWWRWDQPMMSSTGDADKALEIAAKQAAVMFALTVEGEPENPV